MRLWTFTAPTLMEAMTQVRRELGGDAAIVSAGTLKDSGLRQVIATCPLSEAEPAFGTAPLDAEARQNAVLARLAAHGTPLVLADRLAKAAGLMDAPEPLHALAGALTMDFGFEPLDLDLVGQRIMLMGPPGAGKTLTLVKLAAQSILAGRKVQILTADLRRAGGVEELSAFARVLDLEVLITETPGELAEAASRIPARNLLLIDSPAVTPGNDEDLESLAGFAKACPMEPILVLPAGLDALESADTALAFGSVGARRMIVTRMDAARRFGGILSAMEASALSLAGVTHGIDASKPVQAAAAGELTEFLFAGGAALDSTLKTRAGRAGAPAELKVVPDEGDAGLDAALPPPSELDISKRAQLG